MPGGIVMSANQFLQTLGIAGVPPVPPKGSSGGTEKIHLKQESTPRSPCSLTNIKTRHEATESGGQLDPYQVVSEVAQALGADGKMLLRLLSEDDITDIADGITTAGTLKAYMQKMEACGYPLIDIDWRLGQIHEKAEVIWKRNMARTAAKRRKVESVHTEYLNHIMSCGKCYAPLNRYCHMGIELKKRYTALFLPE